MRLLHAGWSALLLGLLTACAGPQAAHLTRTNSQQCVAQIEAFVAQQTGQNVSLNPAALQNSDVLLLEPSNALKGSGKVKDKPLSFTLRKHKSECWIEDLANKTLQTLPDCSCEKL
ncbi:hypothetical protein HQ393_10510 [Chitinibacter bivalviorum]|uniref:Lipoprotein n=1 Tax=Chitinibacter bivalviorum TaxID=2739434 RepID=A0A7H9BJZ7_9NEIS|nr:hypothetical protein [Chitinibacter bivalviorum]QLG88636.1 hypothetical protein HQ393_10510 [Chitinibacter bivalviorum]